MNSLYFTRRERKGLAVVLMIMTCCMLVLGYQNKFEIPKEYDFSEVEPIAILTSPHKPPKLSSKENRGKPEKNIAVHVADKTSIKKKHNASPYTKTTVKFFDFDPNTISKDSLIMLGVAPKTASNLIKYRDKGGVFKKKEDVRKIYGMEKDYEKVAENISIDSSAFFPVKKDSSLEQENIPSFVFEKSKSEEKSYLSIDINSTDTLELQLIRGVGPSYARRIIKYRNSLGGFYNLKQLYEVWGIEEEKMKEIALNFTAPGNQITKININRISIEELKDHPYISWKKAKIVIKYRENNGPFGSNEDLEKVRVLSEDEISKIAPYIDYSIN